jgi:hypothetical protein
VRRFLKTLNTPVGIFVALFVVVAINALLYRDYYLPRVVFSQPDPSASTKRTNPSTIFNDATPQPAGCSNSGVDFLGYSDALDGDSYEGITLGGLSGLAYDANRNLYYAVSDGQSGSTPAHFYTLTVSLEGGRIADPLISDVTVLRDPQGRPFTGANFDGEGIAVTREGEILIVSETVPSIYRFSRDGRFLAELAVPQEFLVGAKGYAKANVSLESLALNPDGRSLFSANEQPLGNVDQGSSERRWWVHLLRYQKQDLSEFRLSQEFLYPIAEGESVSEIATLAENDLLILERETRRIFRISLDKAGAVTNEGGLATSDAILEKKLLVDVDDSCPMPSQGEDAFGLLEGMTLGPQLQDGRRTLLLQSDDNFGGGKESRMIMLGIPSR